MELIDSILKKDPRLGVTLRHLAKNLDMMKAYDRVNWSYIEFILHKFCFLEPFICFVLNCVQTPSISILVNGEPSPWLYPSRGLI